MTGPEHYREAEKCIEQAASDFDAGDRAGASLEIGRAKVHATLALAAATALPERQDENSMVPSPWQLAAGGAS